MSDPDSIDVDAAFGQSTDEQDSDTSEQSDSYSASSDPHVSVDTESNREKNKIRRQEYRALSNRHEYYRREHNPDKSQGIHERVESAFKRLQSRRTDAGEEYRRTAPFRVQFKDPETGETEVAYFHHAIDAVREVTSNILPIIKGRMKARVQKRAAENKWHASRSQPHLCAYVDPSEALFGMNRFCQRFNVPVWKTNLPELEMAKVSA